MGSFVSKPTVLELLSAGHGPTIAHIFYRVSDQPTILNCYIWQGYDIAPDYPELFAFIDFWQLHNEGQLQLIKLGHLRLLAPGTWQRMVTEYRYH